MAGQQLPTQVTRGDPAPQPALERGEREAVPHGFGVEMTATGVESAVFATEAHLWYVEPDAVREPLLLDAYDALLSPAERERNRRFVFARHRHQDLVTRALIRTVLSTYCPAVAPGDWQFASGPFGRPEIAAPQVEPPLRFNLSHTDGLVVCLVAGDREVGVDAEDTRRTSSTIDIAERYFSPDEVRELLAWPAEHRHRRFFEYWTLKEAYIKARGLGLQLPLDQFTIQIPSQDRRRVGQPIGIAFGPGIDDDPRSWQLASFDLMAHHKVAVAIRRHQADLILRLIPTLPVPGGRPIDLLGADGHGRTL